MGRECLQQATGFACWPCARTKAKCEPGSQKWGEGVEKAAGTRKPAPVKRAPAPTKKVKASEGQLDRAESKARPSRRVPVPGPQPRRRLVKSAVYVFSSDEEADGDEKDGAGRKAGPSRPGPGPGPAPGRRGGDLFGSDEESEPVAKKEKGRGEQWQLQVDRHWHRREGRPLRNQSL